MKASIERKHNYEKDEVNLAEISAKPFLKWAGGKTQLLDKMSVNIPLELKNRRIDKYIEPFIGSGAFFFYLSSKYQFREMYISDANTDLINVYNVVKNSVNELINVLLDISERYLKRNEEERQSFFYQIREQFNKKDSNKVEIAACFIFLNRTCFNGLYRVNSKGEFNVPFGRYKNPKICDEENLLRVSMVLKNVQILNVDFQEIEKFVDDRTFVYFDPPYRPLNETSNFTSYSKESFNDDEQIRLASFYRFLDGKGARLMLSNSDPKNIDIEDNFFDDLYRGFNIKRISAKRMINSNADKRGSISELLILNY